MRYNRFKRALALVLSLLLIFTVAPREFMGLVANAVDLMIPGEEDHPYVGRLVKLVDDPGLITIFEDPYDYESGTITFASRIPALMRITGVVDTGTVVYYRLESACDTPWPDDTHPYMQSTLLEFVSADPCPDCGNDPCACQNLRDDATGVTVKGELPAGATLSVGNIALPDGVDDANIFDIKIYDANGNEWQPIDEGKTVTISIPVNTDAEFVDVYHYLDYAPAINEQVLYLSTAEATEEYLTIFADAIAASDREGYVAVSVYKKQAVSAGCVKLETDSFSIYKWENGQFSAIGGSNETNEEFNNGLGNGQDNQVVNEYYATKDHRFTLTTSTIVSVSNCAFSIMNSVNITEGPIQGTFNTTVQGADLADEDGGFWTYHSATVVIPETAAPGETIVVRFKGASYTFYLLIHIIDEVTITFDKNLDEATLTTTTHNVVTDGDTGKQIFTIPSTVPTVPEGSRYTFQYWNTSPDGQGKDAEGNIIRYEAGDKFTPMRDMTLYAIWSADNYFVDYDLNGGAGNVPGETLVSAGTVITLPAAPTKANCVFLGWSVTTDGYSTLYPAGASYTVNSDVTMHAIWGVNLTITVQNGTLTLQMAGEFSSTSLESHLYQNGQPIFTKSEPNGVTTYTATLIEGYLEEAIFTYTHSSSLNAAAASSNDAVSIRLLSDTQTQAAVSAEGIAQHTIITFSATQGATYYISFDSMGGTPIAPVAKVQNSSFTSTDLDFPADPTRQGYKFEGWKYNNGSAFTGITRITSNVTLYAAWSPVNYTVTLNENGGNTVEDLSYTVESTGMVLPTPVREGYTFTGWKVDKTVGSWVANNIYTGAFSGMYGDVTLTAQWSANTYTVTWKNWDGTVLKTENVTFGAAIPAYTGTPTRQQDAQYTYTFSGWSPAVPATMPAENLEFIAQYTQTLRSYTVIGLIGTISGGQLVAQGTASPASQTVNYGAESTAIVFTPAVGYRITGVLVNEQPISFTLNQDGSFTYAAFTVTGDVRVEVFTELKQFTVTWKNADGSILEMDNGVSYGSTPSYDGEVPQQAATAQYTYTFSGWSPTIETVTGDVTYTAQYSTTVNTYTITWIVDGNTTTETYAYGQTPSFKGSTDKAANAQYTYTFTGWSPEIATVTGDATYTAQYSSTVNEYTVTFVDHNGTVLKSGKVEYGSAATAPANPSREGYTFTGWDKTFDNITDNLTVTAQYTINQYTVKIVCDSNMVDVTGAGTYDYNTVVSGTIKPKTGCVITKVTFNGTEWVTSNKEAWTKTITGDLTIEITMSYVVTFDYALPVTNPDDMETQYVLSGEKIVLPKAIPQDDGYTFLGWEDANKDFHVAGEELPITSGTTLKAVWKPKPSTVSYQFEFTENPPDSNPTAPAAIVGDYEKTITLETAPTLAGYTFSHYEVKTASDGDVVWIVENSQFKMPKEDVVVTLVYKPNTNTPYTVYHYLQNLDNNEYTLSLTQNLTGKTGDSITPSLQTPVGFTAPSTQTTTISADGTTVVNYYYTRNSYTITFDSNGGSAVDSITLKFGAAVTAPADPTRPGYTFAGWDKAIPATMPAGDMTITATWTINTYTVKFVDHDGTVLKTELVNHGSAATAPANPSREGYTFTGWDKTFANITGNLTVTAQYTINQYTITFNSNGGSAVDPITQNYGTTVNAPANPTRPGYTFAGWDVAIPATMPAENITLTAKWTENLRSLSIQKTVENIGENPIPGGQTFTFIITLLGDKSLADYQITATGGNVVVLNNKQMSVTFTMAEALNAGATVTMDAIVINGLPLGEYLVEEVNKKGYSPNFGNNDDDITVTLTDASGASVSCTNTYPVYTGDLTITNTVTPEYAEDGVPSDQHVVTIILRPDSEALSVVKIYQAKVNGEVIATLDFTGDNVTERSFDITMTPGQTITISGLPIGAYEVRLTDVLRGTTSVKAGYSTVITYNPETPLIVSDKDPDQVPIATLTSTYLRTVGTLVIEKTIANIGDVDADAAERTFTFQVDLPANVTRAEFGEFVGLITWIDDNTFTFTITISEAIAEGASKSAFVRFENVPSGDYIVKETNIPLGFVPIESPMTAEVRSGAEGSVEFVNQYPVYLITYQIVDEGGTLPGGGTSYSEKVYKDADAIGATVTVLPGYRFVGWFDSADKLLSTELSFAPAKPVDGWEQNVTVYAKFEPLGSLTINKTVDNKDDVALTNQSFTFEIDLPAGKKVDDYGIVDGVNVIKVDEDTIRITITIATVAASATATGSVTLSGLPMGTYTIEETVIADGFVSNWPSNTTTVTLSGVNTTVNADCTNSYPVYKVEYRVDGFGSVTLNGMNQYATTVSEIYNFVTGAPAGATAAPMSGYEFVGWFLGEERVSPELTFVPGKTESNRVYVARFEEIEANIQFVIVDPNGNQLHADTSWAELSNYGTTIGVATGSISSAVTLLDNAYKFVGWYSDAACTQLVTKQLTITPDKEGGLYKAATYYAKFEFNLTSLQIQLNLTTALNEAQNFVLHLKDTTTGKDLTVAVNIAAGSTTGTVTIKGLTVGHSYQVILDNNWAWRYDNAPAWNYATITRADIASDSSFTAGFTAAVDGTLTFTIAPSDNQWLDGMDWLSQWINGLH